MERERELEGMNIWYIPDEDCRPYQGKYSHQSNNDENVYLDISFKNDDVLLQNFR